MAKMIGPRKVRAYGDNFKATAVKLSNMPGVRVQDVAEALGPNHPDVATSLENLTILYRATKRDKEALKLENRAERIRAIKR